MNGKRNLKLLDTEFVFRVFGSKGNFVGTAFLIDSQTLITCAHVVSLATKGMVSAPDLKGEKLSVESTSEPPEKIEAEVIYYFPYQSQLECQDIAFLRLAQEVPFVEPAIWTTQNTKPDLRVKTFGFHREYPTGCWAEGKVTGKSVKGSYQIDGLRTEGAVVKQGMSGAPVWDENENAVIGMISEAHDDPQLKIFFIIPF